MSWRLPTKYDVALLRMNGNNNSTIFADETGKAWTAQGNAIITTAQSYFGGSSAYFDGTNSRITTPDHADWRLDGGSNSNLWTVDFRVRFDGDPGTGTQGFLQQYVDVDNYWSIMFNNNTLAFLVRSGGATLVNVTQTWNPADATWYHVMIVKNGTSGYMHFVDGTQLGSTTTDTDVIPDFAGILRFGRFTDATATDHYFKGWANELRITKGLAREVANFTPPAKPYQPAQTIAFITGR